MADSKSTQKSEAKSESKAANRQLSPASESSDPAVHQILAEIQTAESNGDSDAVAEARNRLADLGYE